MAHDFSAPPADLLRSRAEQLQRLLPAGAGFALLAPNGTVWWSSFEPSFLDDRLLDRLRASVTPEDHDAHLVDLARPLATIPVLEGQQVVGAVLVPIASNGEESLTHALERTSRRLRPVLDRLAHDLAQYQTDTTKTAVLAERTEELEWLFGVTAELRATAGPNAAIEHLLAAAVDRMHASYGVLTVPEKRLNLTYASRVIEDPSAAEVHRKAHQYVLSYVFRRSAPLVANGVPNATTSMPVHKVLAIPITRLNGTPAGVVAFYKPSSLPDFGQRQLYLGRHIARQIETLLNTRHDLQTGLLTRAAVEQEATQIIETHASDSPHTVVCVDIDHLHVVNETFGFEFGDEAIVRVASLLAPPLLPDNAIPGRLAGDRFVVFLTGCDTVQAAQWTQKLHSEVSQMAIGLPPQKITLSVSCGIARVPHSAPAYSKALAAAELACRTAKDRGRDRTEVYLDIDDSILHRRGDILSAVRLRAALEKDRLQLYGQKIVPLRDVTRTIGIECLVRLIAADGQIIAPAEFLCASRRYQLSRAIDEWVIEHLMRALQPHSSTLLHGEIVTSINLSEQSLTDPDFPRAVERYVRQSSLAPGLIVFEVAEAIASRHPTNTEALKRRIKKLGCRFALDDFGTCINSLAYLQSLRPDAVKFDASIIRDLLNDSGAEALVRATVELTDALDVDCIAEHAESNAIARKLRELGVRYAQGSSVHAAEPLVAVLDSISEEESQQLRRLYGEQ